MSKVIRNITTQRPVWTSQPQGVVEIDWSNPITRGLKLCLRPDAGMRDLASPSIPWVAMPGANPSKTVSKAGTGLHTLSTIVCYPHFRVDTPSQTHLLMMDWEGSDVPVSGVLAVGTTINTISLAVNKAAAGLNLKLLAGIQSADSTKLLTTLKEGAFLIKASVAGAATYDRGALVESIPRLAPITDIGGESKVTISGDIYTDGTYVSYSTVYVYMFWDRELSDAEAKSVTANPWQIFQPLARQVPFDLVRGPTEPRQSYMMGTTAPEVSTAMPAAFLKTGWTSQPQGGVGIDWSNPITKGLYVATIAGIGDVLTPAFRFGTDTKISVGPAGRLLSPTDSYRSNLAINFPPRALNARTEVFGQFFPSWRVYGAFLANQHCTQDSYGSPYSDTDLYWKIHGPDWNSGTEVFIGASPVPLTGAHRVIAGTWNKDKNSGYGRCFVDGNELTRSGGSPQTTVSDRTRSSAAWTLGPYEGAGGISFFYAFDRDLSPTEIKSLSANPYQIFAPQSKQIWVAP